MGITLGSFFATYLSGGMINYVSVGRLEAFLGGIIMIIGARLAGGCASGTNFLYIIFSFILIII